MPYVDPNVRKQFDPMIESLCNELNRVPLEKFAGTVNYIISRIVSNEVKFAGVVNYNIINEAIGVLECAKLELYRRLAVPFEENAIERNGDIY